MKRRGVEVVNLDAPLPRDQGDDDRVARVVHRWLVTEEYLATQTASRKSPSCCQRRWLF
jgi:hypothetical protein